MAGHSLRAPHDPNRQLWKALSLEGTGEREGDESRSHFVVAFAVPSPYNENALLLFTGASSIPFV